MSVSGLRGIWTYRSLANAEGSINDFNKIKVWEAELYLEVSTDNRVYGHLGERPAEATGNEPYLTVEGKVMLGEPLGLQWRAKGRPGSAFDGWIYDYQGYILPDWSDGVRQRPAIVGTVIRTVEHDGAPAGSVFSFVAVKSDFVEPRTSIPLAKPVLDLMASAEHRYHHQLWHASRDNWAILPETKKDALRNLGWQPGPNGKERPSLSADRLRNGSGEDFLFMHRRMIQDVRALDPNVQAWRTVPSPGAMSSFDPEVKATQVGNLDGNAVGPAWIIPSDPETTSWLYSLREPSTFQAVFQGWERLYTDRRHLATLSLGELGARIEFTIHNWMHMRWTSVTRDPSSDPKFRGLPIPEGRAPLDFDPKWLDSQYDHLGETFSSHVNPVFWRLHGWVDSRIEDWFAAHDAERPEAIKRTVLDGVQWFATDGKWVITEEPWEGPKRAAPMTSVTPVGKASQTDHDHGSSDHGGGHGGLHLDIAAMQQALAVIFGPDVATPLALREGLALGVPGATRFRRIED